MFQCWTSTSSSPISDVCVCVWWYRFKVVIWLDEHVSVLDLHLQLLNLNCLCIWCVSVGWFMFLYPIDNQIMSDRVA